MKQISWFFKIIIVLLKNEVMVNTNTDLAGPSFRKVHSKRKKIVLLFRPKKRKTPTKGFRYSN